MDKEPVTAGSLHEDGEIIGTRRKPSKHHIREERTGRIFTIICIVILLIVIGAMVLFVGIKGLSSFFKDGISLGELFSRKWSPEGEPAAFGVLPFIFGSFSVSIIAALIASPLGICAAIFMTQILPGVGRKYLQPVIELLAGIPSVVYGFIGISVIVPFLRDGLDLGRGFGIAAGALVLAVMILPTITTIATDALAQLPNALKEGSFALGATRWQTIARIVIPTTLPALLTGVVLGMARAFGEALAVQMVIGNAPFIPSSLFESASTLTSIITLNMTNTVNGSPQNDVLWTMALILLLMTFVFVFLVRALEGRARRK
jgi:phosphate transport system permease protein